VPTIRRTHTLARPPEEVWAVAGDPHHMPRWWPRAQRVERVSPSGFTLVLGTQRGRAVRVDYRRGAGAGPRHAVWEQQLEGSPFERMLSSATLEIDAAPVDGGTEVALTLRQKLRGLSRFGGLLMRRGSSRLLDEALAGLEEACG
jgi:uncharacterized protein YndB with AHSA1/START domain